MIEINIQFFGGRGGSGGKGSSGSSKSSLIPIPNVTQAQVNKMPRSRLEILATSLYVNEGIKQGLSKSEALYRVRSLMSGNSDAQLKKYIKRRI